MGWVGHLGGVGWPLTIQAVQEGQITCVVSAYGELQSCRVQNLFRILVLRH